MKPLRNGDLISADDAAELIDSAQAAATELARQNAALKAEIARLRDELDRTYEAFGLANDGCCKANGEISRLLAAIREWNDSCYSHSTFPHDEEKQARRAQAVEALRKIAREGR